MKIYYFSKFFFLFRIIISLSTFFMLTTFYESQPLKNGDFTKKMSINLNLKLIDVENKL